MQTEFDSWLRERLEAVRQAEESFLAIRACLNERQQEQLDAYIAACEDLAYYQGQRAISPVTPEWHG